MRLTQAGHSNESILKDKFIAVGVSGGIAAYKACDLVSRLVKAGAQVQVILTASATRFVGPLTFQTLSGRPVITEMFDEPKQWNVAHVSVADAADLFVLAPATANIIGKLRCGIADDFLSTTLLAIGAPLVIAPAMNVNMFHHPAVQENLAVLQSRGAVIVEPDEGRLACGVTGKGRLAEVERILAAITETLAGRERASEKADSSRRGEPEIAASAGKSIETGAGCSELAGYRVLITAGGTREPIDPVRYISNRSSGKMGYALAREALRRGAEVILVTTPTGLPLPEGAEVVHVESADEMYEAVMSRFDAVDVVVKAAAVADYRPAAPAEQKMKKQADRLFLELVRTPDILAELGRRKERQVLVGFAAETNDLETYALDKLRRKNVDLMVANDVTQTGAGFGVDTNIVTIFDGRGGKETLKLMAKEEVASRIFDRVIQILSNSCD
ncbi:phosphopantothenoylcysteine decarboxylase/phosphopantothenate--cysteine ligase [Heliomicrobium modesticaldum Ice1]|uniref:Coenzyme A biosynthesis bifunctional protein CoaBC n=1 Tax=Heliobacterium modesticaldum (strain ATCC 51547 / Ice1) TaxID=498761 RepID=B0TGS5_HELMI|nr:bifunctional phosphopantothenoylcysteine decarboxylase/phosphopantothenate--cysteine ligase CoaBC [Heliomicrobium modesticaldum]ABZ84686.1 phosphopantothenoylcysteine decarboxylase/phosphopantothenate--cysteine ligase [Heliomicrobium modesticaldum Ice1]